MKIAIDASRYSHAEATGVENYSYHLIKEMVALNKKKGEIVLYSPNRKNIDGVKQRIVPGKRLWTLVHLSAAISKDKPDLLFVPSHTLPLKLAKKNVITIHDVAFKYLRSAYSWREYLYLDWSSKRAVKKATKIIAPSQATADDLVKFYKCPKEKIEIIHHGFESSHINKPDADHAMKNSDAFKYFGISPKMKYLLFVGRLESKKNLIHLIAAFAKFRKVHPEYFLVLAGKRGQGFKEILAAVDEHEIMRHVIMPGYVSEAEKTALYQHCEIFVFPSLYEGFGLPILESFYFKKPVLTSHVSCIPEIAGDAALYVDPYDIQDIANGIEKLVTDEKYAQSLVENGQARLKNFSWKSTAQKTLDLIYEQ